LAATPPPTPSRFRPVRRRVWRVFATKTSTTASWKLAARFETTCRPGRPGRSRRVLAAEGVEDGRLEAREAEIEPIVVQEGARQGVGRRIASTRGPLDLGTTRITQAE